MMQELQDTLLGQQEILQLLLIICSFLFAKLTTVVARQRITYLKTAPDLKSTTKSHVVIYRLGLYLPYILGAILLKLAVELVPFEDDSIWLVRISLAAAALYVFISFVRDFIKVPIVSRTILFIGVPLLALDSLGALPYVNSVLESIFIEVGNIKITLLGILRVAIFGSLIFWLGRVSNSTGQEVIRKQQAIDFRTREVVAKLFEIGVFVAVFLLLLQIMGINLTALAVFGGALGVGLGFGLQAVASNFISGLIILLDRSLSIGDYVELEDGRTGFVTALNMRSTTLETFDGKDVMVPNEKFITSSFVNWTHKNVKQRYRVDFSVAYDSDIRHLVEVIKEAVAKHPQVLAGEEYPIEERPDCEIDSFGDSGVNMFVEFWIEAIDDGKNRVGGDLLLIIFEAMRENGFTIPFPQREVRVLNEKNAASGLKPQ